MKTENNKNSVIALDVGGSSVKSGLVKSDGSIYFFNHTPINSQASKEKVLRVFVEIIQTYLPKVNPNEFLGIAIGFPGPFDYENGLCLIRGQSKYDNLYQVNIRDELSKLLDFKKPILFCNDAKAAITGEANYGAGQDFYRVLGITLGTGLGAGFIVNGVSVHEGQGIPPSAELFPLIFNGKRADDLFSTRGLIERFKKRGLYYDNVAEVTKEIKRGDTFLMKVFREFGEDLGQFLRPFVYDFTADVLIVLGGIANALDYFRSKLEAQLDIPVHPGKIQNSALLGVAKLFYYE